MFDLIRGDLSGKAHRPNLVEADGNAPASLILMPDGTPHEQRTDLLSDETSSSSLSSNSPPNRVFWLTDELLFNYQRCNRRAFLDTFHSSSDRDPPSDYVMKLRHDSLAHQAAVVGQESVHVPQYPLRNWVAGWMATEALMQQGVERITQGVILARYAEDIHLVSSPNLLVRQAGQSKFGDWLYVPTEIKLGKRPKQDYQITATFHAYVLAIAQEAWSETSWLVLRQRGAYGVDLAELLPKMELILEGCIQMLRSQQEPEVFISHSRCDLCHWFSYCYSLARGDRHLSLLPGVTPSRYIYLRQLQLTTVEALAATPPQQLELLPGFGPQVAHRMVRQAQATLQNRAMVRPFTPDEAPVPLFQPEELPTAAVELYFDIEAAPEQNLVYLHGVLVVDRVAQTETFYPLLADRPEDEGLIWEDFLDLVWRYPHAPIFHFCPYEVQTVKRLATHYGAPAHRIDPLLQRFVDLHERVNRVAILPVESYALKPIARWLGFNWRDSEANGAQSIYWYAEWLATGDRTFLEAILRYNEDDCRATYRVKDWLVDFTQNEAHSP